MAQRTAKQLREENSRRAKLAALREAEQRRKRRTATVVVAVGAVVVLIVAMVVVKLVQGTPSGSDQPTAASSKVVRQVTSMPAATYNRVGVSKVDTGTKNHKVVVIPVPDPPHLATAGKPEVVYVGAEYCPYCAAERWAVVTALARFGTFSGLGQTSSSSTDVAPDTPTLSFHGASYTSRYVAFKGFEVANRQGQPLDKVPATLQRLVNKYGREPYVPGAPATHPAPIPFIDFAGRDLISGASYDPAILHGLTHQQVATAITDPSTPISKSVLTTANTMTAMICQATHNQPADVCDSSGVKAAAATLPQP